MLTLAQGEEFVVSPGAGTYLWLLYAAMAVACAGITAAKGRWGWLAAGLVFGGLLWPVAALMIATPDSLWARTYYGDAKMARARRAFPRRLPHGQVP